MVLKNLGKDRFPMLSDRPNTPYTEAVILEIQRRGNVVNQVFKLSYTN